MYTQHTQSSDKQKEHVGHALVNLLTRFPVRNTKDNKHVLFAFEQNDFRKQNAL